MNRRTLEEGRVMQEGRLLNAIFELVERVTKAELTNSGCRLPHQLLPLESQGHGRRESPGCHPALYAQWDPPSMDEVRERHRAGAMEDLDWRVLKVENEARKLEEAEGEPRGMGT